jgi:membrane fusion protein, multidrug efflux system
MKVCGREGCRIPTLLPAALALAFVIASCSGSSADELGSASYQGDGTEEPLAVEARKLTAGKLISRITGAGIIQGREEVWITSETQGTIQEVFVVPGAPVNPGDPLLKVDDTLAYWEMKRAEQQFKTADFEYRGTKSSFESGAVSEIEYNRSYSTWFSSRSAFEAASKAYENCTLRAPVAGRVSRMDTSLSPGGYLRSGAAVMKIVNTDEFLMTISLGQREVGLITTESPAEIFIELADRSLRAGGVVLDISAGSDEETGSFPVRIAWKNEWDGLVKPGMTARAEVETVRGEEGIIIPYDSLLEKEGKKWVFLVLEEKGVTRAGPREVVPGTRMGNRIRIDGGLEAGDILITSGLTSLYPGAPVKLTFTGQ